MDLTLIITGAIAAIALIGAIVLTIFDFKRKKDKEMTKPTISLGLVTMHAVVESIKNEANADGLFEVNFKTDGGEIITVAISGEMRDGFEAGLAGELNLTDGLLTTFIPDGYNAEEENA